MAKSIFRLVIGMALLASIATCVSGCVSNPNKEKPSYEICNTPNCGDAVEVKVE